MLVAKQVADFLTFLRALLPVIFIWLGLTRGSSALPAMTCLLILSWTSDALDGPLARRSSLQYHSWLGDHDLYVDMAASAGLLAYLVLAGFVSPLLAVIYTITWLLIFLQWGVLRSPAMLFQAPIYAWFIWLAITLTPVYGSLIIAWILAVVIFTWPRFLNEVVPGFLAGMNAIRSKR